MSGSLRDQLLKAGLVNEKKLKQAVREQRKDERKAQGQNKVTESEEVKRLLKQQQAEKLEKDRVRNLELQRERDHLAAQAEIRQLILKHRVTKGNADQPYNFEEQGKIRRIYVDDSQRLALSRGQLAIAKSQRDYELIPMSVAEKIRQRDAGAIVFALDSGESAKMQDAASVEAHDPYSGYEVPDDLMW